MRRAAPAVAAVVALAACSPLDPHARPCDVLRYDEVEEAAGEVAVTPTNHRMALTSSDCTWRTVDGEVVKIAVESYTSEADARSFFERLVEEGHPEAEVFAQDGRVVLLLDSNRRDAAERWQAPLDVAAERAADGRLPPPTP